jgi:replication-associated recombination protein RarA
MPSRFLNTPLLLLLLLCRAIAQAVVRSLTLWQGPPGTGKTRTLLAMVEVLVKTALAEVRV